MKNDNYSAKIHTYSALSGCFLPPDENLHVHVTQLNQHLAAWIPDAEKPLGFMLNDLKMQENGHTELSLDYSRLFLGPFEVLAPPFGSIYLNPSKKMIMDETTAEVADLYSKTGLALDENFHNPADHITAELEFMHFLYYQEHTALNADNEDQSEEFKKYRLEFFNKHLGKWGPEFARKVEKNARIDFYRQLGLLTRMVLSAEAKSQTLAGGRD